MTSTPVDGEPAARSSRTGRRVPLSWLGVVPFLAYIGLFLLLPTVLVVVQAFADPDGRPTLDNVRALSESYVLTAFWRSIELSFVTALVGAVLGALLAYLLVSGPADGFVRRVATAAAGVLAQFGGVTLAFAFIVSVGNQGLITLLLQNIGIGASGGWLYQMSGLIVVYLYFQIPLMVLVFLPALDGVKPQWREATESLGGNSWAYWRHVAVPLLTPPFLGAFLLLFANAFAAYATAAALISQGGVIIPLQIRAAITSETVLGRENVANALALGMVIVVAVAMALYSWMQRRSARWLQ
ncbi:ABC transporter permease subunit [Kineosporia sp. NBRC 101731]|uniref:ABC transporter permease n=1 Tax=Kineosporia sp. NBRC 101731 TaxID=3032199 RepID=UPI002554F516|nr:ABC transporter permease subunit [Kineosporia sp. NBRC 101731]